VDGGDFLKLVGDPNGDGLTFTQANQRSRHRSINGHGSALPFIDGEGFLVNPQVNDMRTLPRRARCCRSRTLPGIRRNDTLKTSQHAQSPSVMQETSSR
jgi:hypothetical protein